tara:strand:+ start:287 stop:514 length:228 start_codon:yes stop_codon:yes gene_type:complete
MIQDLFLLNGYGQFVWPAFIFAFLSCYLLYAKTLNEFKKQQILFLREFKQAKNSEIVIRSKEKTVKKNLSQDLVF